jgi:acyl carrier protein
MTRDEIFEEIQRAMAGLFDLEPTSVTWDSRLADDLDLDSIDAIDLIIKMQDITGCRLDQEAMRSIRTVADIVDLVERLGLSTTAQPPLDQRSQ